MRAVLTGGQTLSAQPVDRKGEEMAEQNRPQPGGDPSTHGGAADPGKTPGTAEGGALTPSEGAADPGKTAGAAEGERGTAGGERGGPPK